MIMLRSRVECANKLTVAYPKNNALSALKVEVGELYEMFENATYYLHEWENGELEGAFESAPNSDYDPDKLLAEVEKASQNLKEKAEGIITQTLKIKATLAKKER